jgi:hypothetical protein
VKRCIGVLAARHSQGGVGGRSVGPCGSFDHVVPQAIAVMARLQDRGFAAGDQLVFAE